MKANELMLGDWVYSPEGELCKVHMIEGRCEAFVTTDNYAHDDGTFYMYSVEEIQPIPLTIEILEKNGFKYEEIIQPHWISEDGRILLKNDESLISSNNKWSVHVDNEDMQSIGYFEITYVHELQHALRFVKIEKKIEL